MSLKYFDNLETLQHEYFFRLPYAHIIADYVWPGLVMSPKRIIAIQKLEFCKDDIVIVTYPKSGTTWMSELISAIVYEGDTDILRKFRQEVRVPWLELDQDVWWIRTVLKWGRVLGWNTKLELPKSQKRVFFTHLPLELLPKSILYGECKVIYVARNPKDNAVSFFHHHRMARFLGVQKKLSWNDFFALYATGSLYCGSWFEHVASFWRFTDQNSHRVHFVTFEDMKKDLDGQVRNIMRFIGVELNEEQLHKVFDHCSFDSMKDNKMANRDISLLFDKKVCKFMRKGEVGDWKNYMCRDQSDLLDELFREKLAGTVIEGWWQNEMRWEEEKQ